MPENIVWIAMERMNPNDVGDPLTYHKAAPAGRIFHYLSQISWYLPEEFA